MELLDIFMGAAPDSPCFWLDDLIVRSISAALLASVVLVLLCRGLGYFLVAVCFLLSGLEVLVTWFLGQPITGAASAMMVVIFVLMAGVLRMAARMPGSRLLDYERFKT